MQTAETVTFGGSALDRRAGLRRDAAGLKAALAAGTVLPLWRGKPLMEGDHPVWVPAGHPVLELAREPVFLGIDDGTPRFAADLSDWTPDPGAEVPGPGFLDQTVQQHPAMAEGQGFVELRGVMALLSPRAAELVATAKAVLQWHASHGFCAACGARSDMVQGGWQRSCPACKTQHFPRTDPVVIMLAEFDGKVLVGRQPRFPAGNYSALAGFLEPGESIEEAVRREIFEEAGVRCGPVRYVTSQPWPFGGSQLMIACIAEAEGMELTLDTNELEDAKWVSKEEARAALDDAPDKVFSAPPPFAIANSLLKHWAWH